MSFEGFYQLLCKNGHQWTADVYDFYMAAPSRETTKCPVCNAEVAWWHIVDLTNGSFDDRDNRIDGYIKLEVLKPAKECKCPTCDVVHIVEPTTYKIPDKISVANG